MAVWLRNLQSTLQTHNVVILHGNVRDLYLDEAGVQVSLIELVSRVVLAHREISEIVEYFPFGLETRTATGTSASRKEKQSELTDTAPTSTEMQKPTRVFARWAKELRDPNVQRLVLVHYLDKLIDYKPSYSDDERERIAWLERVIHAISPNSVLVMVAIRDSLIPMELYTNCPKCRLFSLPLPSRIERRSYFERQIDTEQHLDLLADLTEGLYLHDVVTLSSQVKSLPTPTTQDLRRCINQYRLGEKEDYWSSLSISKIDSAFDWFTESEGVRGQDHAVHKIIDVLCRARAGLSGTSSGSTAKPKGVLFFAGPPGVGKTLLAKKLAKFLFSSEEAFIRIDMSELKEAHSISKLIGSPPGYVGFERGGLLTNAVREKPFSVVLFDEIEKAHPSIMDVFLQLLDEGRMTDSRGQTVFFTETVLVFTSNIGNRDEERAALDAILTRRELSESDRQAQVQTHFIGAVKHFFRSELSRPELLRRFGSNIVPFNHISGVDVQRGIISLHLKRIEGDFAERFKSKGMSMQIEEGVVDFLLNKFGKTTMTDFGGGGVTNAIEDDVITPLAREILQAEYEGLENVTIVVGIEDSQVVARASE